MKNRFKAFLLALAPMAGFAIAPHLAEACFTKCTGTSFPPTLQCFNEAGANGYATCSTNGSQCFLGGTCIG